MVALTTLLDVQLTSKEEDDAVSPKSEASVVTRGLASVRLLEGNLSVQLVPDFLVLLFRSKLGKMLLQDLFSKAKKDRWEDFENQFVIDFHGFFFDLLCLFHGCFTLFS